MALLNIVMDEQVSHGMQGGPMYNTTIVTSKSGAEQRNIDWDIPLSRWTVDHVVQNDAKRRYLLTLFRTCKGMGHTYLFKDWMDYRVEASAVVGYHEGVTTSLGGTTYQLQKRYYNGITDEIRDIKHPKASSVKLFNGVTELTEGVHFTVNYATGVMTTASTFTHWTGEYYYEVRFDVDDMKMRMDNPVYGMWGSISVVEVR